MRTLHHRGYEMQVVKLFSEAVEEVQYICEEKESGDKNYKIRGVFMQADIKNRNGRVYPMEVLEKEVQRYNKKFINENRAYGELGHPDGPTVNLERVSHMVTELYPDGKNFIGEAKILKTPMGEIVKNLMDEGAKLGVSSRGMGSLDQRNGANYVRDDFYLATAADIVADPSAPNAFVEGVMEGKEWVWNHGALVEAHLAKLKKEFDVKEHKRQTNKEALEFAKFLKML
tara:strand:- start:365 stop:1051 length:687 start_codon:yes stop_codon:yes gene_type:complete